MKSKLERCLEVIDSIGAMRTRIAILIGAVFIMIINTEVTRWKDSNHWSLGFHIPNVALVWNDGTMDTIWIGGKLYIAAPEDMYQNL